MRYNQFSYISVDEGKQLADFTQLGFALSATDTGKDNLEIFVRATFFHYPDTDYPVSLLAADVETDLLTFFQSERPLTDEVFYTVALQLLGFVPGMDFTDWAAFIDKLAFPIAFSKGNLLVQLHQLLATRRKDGNSLIDYLVSQGLLPMDNDYHYFNGKSLATFDTNHLVREVVYVDSQLDTDGDGETDLVKVSIIRPKTSHQLPTMMTASPYHQGINGPASDKKLYKMASDLTVKPAGSITVEPHDPTFPADQTSSLPVSPATETFAHIGSYSLNDYMLARGFANIYVSGIGTAGSTGFMTSGDYQLISSYKSVIDWLNGRAIAYTSHKRDQQVLATWATGEVTTTGISYLGTMSTGLATTGVDGLKVIIAEAGISSWYEYYRENGLVCSPGGYPGEDLDSLTALTYSRSLLAGDFVHSRATYEKLLEEQAQALDRETGNYNQFWENRNYLPHAHKVKATVVYTHGLQDWNVKPRQVYNILKALPDTVDKHVVLHQGQHVYLNNWQSIDFRESINALLTQKLLKQDNGYHLPAVIWQDNAAEQTWQALNQFGQDKTISFDLGQGEQVIRNQYEQETFERYDKDFKTFKADLFADKANAICIDFPVTQAVLINGQAQLQLTLKSSENRGLLSAQLLHQGKAKRHTDTPAPLGAATMDNGQSFQREPVRELPWVETEQRVMTKGVLNLQNRDGLMTVSDLPADDWVSLTFDLQPTIFRLTEGDTLRLLLYTTDFEHTVRDNSDYQLTVDLSQAKLYLPIDA